MKIVVVIGASRGIGLGFTQYYLEIGYQVIVTCRYYANSEGLQALKQEYGQMLTIYDNIDITDIDRITTFANNIQRLDLLILNAGIKGYSQVRSKPTMHTSAEMLNAYNTNVLAHDNLMRLFFNKLQHANAAAVYISSAIASIQDNESGGYHPYRVSKVAGNQMILNWSHELLQTWKNDLADLPCAFAICPGWVKTDMGGSNATLSVRASVSMMAHTIEKTIRSKQTYGLLMYHGKFLETYRIPKKLEQAIKSADDRTLQKIHNMIGDRENEILLRLMTPSEFQEQTHHKFPEIEELLSSVYNKLLLPERLDTLINLYEALQTIETEDELLKKLKGQIFNLLNYILNAHDGVLLQRRIDERKNFSRLGMSMLTLPDPLLPGYKGFKEAEMVANSQESLESPRSGYKKINKKVVTQALQKGQMKAVRSECQRNDFHFTTERPSPIEREYLRILPCRLHAGFIQVIGNEKTGIIVIPFSTRDYADLDKAKGICMFIMTQDGDIFVGSRRWFAEKCDGKLAFLHSSLSAGQPVVCAGLLETEIISSENGKDVEALIFISNITGHFYGELPHLKQALHQLMLEGVINLERNTDITLIQNCRPWPSRELPVKERIYKQGFPVDILKLMNADLEDLYQNNPTITEFVSKLSEKSLQRGMPDNLTTEEKEKLEKQTCCEKERQSYYYQFWYRLQPDEKMELLQLRKKFHALFPQEQEVNSDLLTEIVLQKKTELATAKEKFGDLKNIELLAKEISDLTRLSYLSRWEKSEKILPQTHMPSTTLTSW